MARMNKKFIGRETSIEEIVNDYPELIKILSKYNIRCIACGEPIWGTLEEIAKDKNIENIDNIIDELNSIVLKNYS
jgi:methionine synthase II (cobalamin-independent)